MNESKALVPAPTLTPSVWQMIETIAPVVWRSGIFGIGSPEAASAIMLKGYELGLNLAASFEFIQVIQGKPTISPRGALALIQQSNKLADLKIEDLADNKGPTRCRVTMKRTNDFSYTTEFSMEDAKRAGLVKPDSGWAKYPANMLRWRAVGYCADVVFPDVIGGMKRADEFDAEITEDGDVVTDADEWNVLEVIQNHKPTPLTLAQLVTEYGAEAVMTANAGKVPANDSEVQAIAEKLGA